MRSGAKPDNIDDYLAKLPEDARKTLETIRKRIQVAAPKATEKISYGIPTFYHHGNLVAFAGVESPDRIVAGGHNRHAIPPVAQRATAAGRSANAIPLHLVQERLHLGWSRADGTDSRDKLFLRAPEFLHPVTDFPSFAHVDATGIRRDWGRLALCHV